MLAGIHHLTIEQNTSFDREWIWTDSAGDPVPMLNFTGIAEGGSSGEDAAFTLTTANGGMTLGAADGTVAITMTETAAGLLEESDFENGKWYLKVTSPAGVSTRFLKGNCELDLEDPL